MVCVINREKRFTIQSEMRCINLPTGRSYSPSRVEKIIIERECYCCGLESVKNCRIRKLTPPPPQITLHLSLLLEKTSDSQHVLCSESVVYLLCVFCSSASCSFKDSYGFIRGARESESEMFHFVCRELKQHYSSFFRVRLQRFYMFVSHLCVQLEVFYCGMLLVTYSVSENEKTVVRSGSSVSLNVTTTFSARV